MAKLSCEGCLLCIRVMLVASLLTMVKSLWWWLHLLWWVSLHEMCRTNLVSTSDITTDELLQSTNGNGPFATGNMPRTFSVPTKNRIVRTIVELDVTSVF